MYSSVLKVSKVRRQQSLIFDKTTFRFPSIFKLTVDKKCAMLVELITKEKERFHQPGLCEIVKFVIKRLEEEGNAMLTKRLCNQLSQVRLSNKVHDVPFVLSKDFRDIKLNKKK